MRVLIADSVQKVRSALRLLVQACRSDVEIIEASLVSEVRALAAQTEFDIALIDWSLPREGGRTAVKLVRRHQPRACVIALSGIPGSRQEAQELGADAFVYKGEPPDALQSILEDLVACHGGSENRRYKRPTTRGTRAMGNRTAQRCDRLLLALVA